MSLAAISPAQVPRSRGWRESSERGGRCFGCNGFKREKVLLRLVLLLYIALLSSPCTIPPTATASTITPVHAPPHESTQQSNPSNFTTERVPKATTPGDPRAVSKVSLTSERAHWRSQRAAQAPADCRRAISPLHSCFQRETTTVQARVRAQRIHHTILQESHLNHNRNHHNTTRQHNTPWAPHSLAPWPRSSAARKCAC